MAIIPEIIVKIKEISKNEKDNILWYFYQLFPLTYYADYEIEIKGKVRQVCVWKMWLGRSYNINTWEVLKKVEHMTDKEIVK